MAFFGFFRRWPPIREATELADFIDQQSAFLVQRYIYDYAHARSGPYSQSLLKQPEFMQAVERSRWTAYPLGLAMVGEMVEGVLRPHAGDERRLVLDPLRVIVIGVFDRYDVPQPLGTDAWQAARDELSRKLDQIGTHPPKRVTDIPEPYAERYFSMMPFDKALLTNDVPTTRSYLRLTLTNIRDELTKRMDARAISALLKASAQPQQADID
jgi:hypothetical protein